MVLSPFDEKKHQAQSLNLIPWTDREQQTYIYTHVCFQSFLSVCYAGIFYGWGSISDAISKVFSPDGDDYLKFENKHGAFGAIIIVLLSSSFMPFLQYFVVRKNWVNDLQLQWIGLFMTLIGLVLGGISLRYRILWLYYIGSTALCGFGGLAMYRRSVFSHQLWFKHINKPSLGSGLYGFFIGIWTVIFFLISVPLLKAFPVDIVLYIYAGILGPCEVACIFLINENRLPSTSIPPSTSTAINYETIPDRSEINSAIDCSANLALETVKSDVEDSSNIEHQQLLKRASDVGIDCDPIGYDFEMHTTEVLQLKETWLLIFFSAAILTPGWGIKLASYSMLRESFKVSLLRAAVISSIYVALYALGRLVSGVVAEKLGVMGTFDIVIGGMFALLILLPQTSSDIMEHNSPESLGCKLFEAFLCIIGLLYGGSMALFYAINFSIYGAKNYKIGLSTTLFGFGISVIIGGFTSAYSFSINSGATDEAIRSLASSWYYGMAAECLLAWGLLHTFGKIDYRRLLIAKVEQLEQRKSQADYKPQELEEEEVQSVDISYTCVSLTEDIPNSRQTI